MDVNFLHAGGESVADVLSHAQQPAEVGVRRDWQRPDEAAAVGSLLGAAALLLDARRDAKAGSRRASAAQTDGPAGAEENTQFALVCHIGRHLHLASRFLLAPWQLQHQVKF